MITFEPPYYNIAAVIVLFLFAGASLTGMLRSGFDLDEDLLGRWLLVLLPSVIGLTAIFLLRDQVNVCVGTP